MVALSFGFLLLFFFNDTATTEIYTLSLHDALPISDPGCRHLLAGLVRLTEIPIDGLDRKSTRLNSSHTVISYAVFCLKQKKKYANDAASDNIDAFKILEATHNAVD